MDRDEEQRRRRGEHTRSYSQDRPIGSGENARSLVRGVKQWLPDIPGSVGDMADMLYAGGANVLQGQKRRSIAPLGAGPAIRRAIAKKSPLEQVEMRATPEADWVEEGARFANPAMFMSPKNIAQLGGLALAGGVPGAATAVVKPRGGNWYTGSGSEMENALRSLLKGPIMGVLDPKNDLVADLQEYLKVARAESPELVPQYERQLQSAIEARPLNNWIKGPLTKYVKRDLATEGDPIRKLLELDQPVSHMNLQDLLANAGEPWIAKAALNNRFAHGFPREGTAKSGYARGWEDTSDAMLTSNDAGLIKKDSYITDDHPMKADWVKALPDDARIYDFANDEAPDWLGLSHLRDELWNAVRQDSDLPENLRLKPEDFQQLGIEKAVRHVSDINNWRANKKAAASQEMLSGPGVKLLREYPENNPKGLRWVELNDAQSPEEFEQSISHLGPKEWDQAVSQYRENRRAALQKQLKYEGDTMGHCVGGYCDDVASGRSRIFSLRDAKGEPHVTIETRPEAKVEADNTSWALNHLLSKEDLQPLYDAASKEGLSTADPAFWEHVSKGVATHPKWLAYQAAEPAHTLVQAKGKQNKAPNAEYTPFVQDFLRQSPAGKWGEIGESPENLGFKTYEEAKKYIEGYAQGGLVGRQEFNGAVGYILD